MVADAEGRSLVDVSSSCAAFKGPDRRILDAVDRYFHAVGGYDGVFVSTEVALSRIGCQRSSLDNKYWFDDHRPALGVYQDVLDVPTCNAFNLYNTKLAFYLDRQDNKLLLR